MTARENIRQRAETAEEGRTRRNKAYVQKIFESFKDLSSESILAPSLGRALSELGMYVDATEIDGLLQSRNLDDNGGLNLQEFMSLVGTPSPIEEWVKTLPLSELVLFADALLQEDCLIKDQLRHLSKITQQQLEKSCQIIMGRLFKTLQEQLAILKVAFDKLDNQDSRQQHKVSN
jgi:hypothetical protein